MYSLNSPLLTSAIVIFSLSIFSFERLSAKINWYPTNTTNIPIPPKVAIRLTVHFFFLICLSILTNSLYLTHHPLIAQPKKADRNSQGVHLIANKRANH